MLTINPFLLLDSYKLTHPEQYPSGTEYVYSNITPRGSRLEGVNQVVVFGLQYFLKEYLIRRFNEDFFQRPKDEVIAELESFLNKYLGEGVTDISKYEKLHDLGYLPLKIKSLPEGTLCPIGVPYCTIVNTNPEFYWLTNTIETIMQNTLWNPLTSATIARQYRALLDRYAQETCDNNNHVPFQAHNFSMRGMSSFESSLTTDAGHLLSFVGSDTVPGMFFVEKYYGADIENDLISCSVPATEHAVTSAGQKDNEYDTIKRLITETYPRGIVSIVSDTWDLWNVLSNIAPSLKEEIEARDGKVVFRPDSGNPVKIICGYKIRNTNLTTQEVFDENSSDDWHLKQTATAEVLFTATQEYVRLSDSKIISENEALGCVKLLDRYFGHTVNSKGYKELNPKVGVIYGDSISYKRADQICRELKESGYASSNIVFGVGSFTYQYNTRDTFSIACKATHAVINGESVEIFKDPITDDGTKKSAKGLLKVEKVEGAHGSALVLRDCVSPEEEGCGELRTVFENGNLVVEESFDKIRERVCQN